MPRFPSFTLQILHWANRREGGGVEAMVFTWDPYANPYDYHLWTINVEYRCSMLVFLFFVAFSKLTNHVRITSLCIFILCLWYLDAWHENLFILLVLIAVINQVQAAYSASTDSRTTQSRDKQANGSSQNLWRNVLVDYVRTIVILCLLS